MLYDERWGKKAKSTKSKLQSWQVILLLAADELETNGWCQGDFAAPRFDGAGQKVVGISHCALGAIRVVGQNNIHQYTAEATLEFALELPIVSWNDHPARTKEEVVAKLREVANGEVTGGCGGLIIQP